MGRFQKIILDKAGLNRRETGYYSTPNFIAKYLTQQLIAINPNGSKVIDPAVGQEELLEDFFRKGKEIESLDIVDYGDKVYSNFKKQDFIEYYIETKLSNFFSLSNTTDHDYWIANPPYNCHEIDFIKDNKQRLQKVFGGVGVHNMYALFLAAMIDLAKEGAVLGVIISDSFLTATMHSGLRKKILQNCSIHQLILCPSDLFWSQKADVRTVILILQKGTSYQSKVKILNRPPNTTSLMEALSNQDLIEVDLKHIMLGKNKGANQFIVDVHRDILKLFKNERISDLYHCITGISTGNDKKYLSNEKKMGYSIPFYKNPGSRKFVTTPDAYLIDHFIDESKVVKDFMVRNKQFVGKKGIACSSMGLPFSACYLPENSTFGVNPNIFLPEEDIFWMLSYLNSSLVTYLVRGVLIRSNMVTSGYISQLPVLNFNYLEKKQLSKIAENVINGQLDTNEAIIEIDRIVFKSIGIDDLIVQKIKHFALNLSRSV